MTVLSRVQRGDTYAGYTDLRVMCCPVCGVLYAAPEVMLHKAERDKNIWWHCPNGHELHFPGKSLEQQLREAKEATSRERALRDQTEASNRALRGVVTRTRRAHARTVERVAAGVCPCCTRSFQNLARHMKAKHPDYQPE
jgi:hypothetical protein